jgi:acyl-CoA dehydrogenase
MATSASPHTQVLFDLDDEHLAFREVCERFTTREMAPLVKEAEASATFPLQLWPAMAAAGLLGVGHPEEHGGSGGGTLALAILSESLARNTSGGMAITPLVSSYMAAPHIARFGSDEQKQRYLDGVLAGTQVAAIAVTEPGAGSDVAGLTTRARRDDAGFWITGSKMFITNAGLADYIIVAARTSGTSGHDGISTFIVERGEPGLTLSPPLQKLGWHASDTREVVLDDCFVPEDRVLGTEGRGFQQIMEAFQVERIVLAGMALGLAGAAIRDASEYAQERRVFGLPIAQRQAIRHRIAEMATELQAARVLTYQAAVRADGDHPEAPETVAMAKLFAARAASRIVDEAVQIFGGYGFIEETPIVMHYRDARILRIGGGTDEVQLEILSKRLLGRA